MIDSNVTYGLAAIAAGNADHAAHLRADDLATSTTDTLANIMHACGRHGIDFEQALDSARMHYREEVAEALDPDNDDDGEEDR